MSHQTRVILVYMRRHGAIDNLTAWRECSVYALSQRLGEIRRSGVKLKDRWKLVRNANGRTSRVKEWKLA